MKIEPINTTITEFFLLGLDVPHLQFLLFIIFLCIYVVTVFSNTAVICVYMLSSSLHTPMYFFLANFSFLELCYVSSTVPKMLSNLLAEHKTISFLGCAAQMYFFLLLGGAECYMLGAMAYDRYHAICHPLLYSINMNKNVCVQLIAGSWLIGAVNSLIHTVLTFKLTFCSDTINHFFCDVPPLLRLACTSTWLNETVVFLISGCVIIGSCILTIISYVHIISTIVSIHSNSGRNKSFSTCASHFTVVTIFYGSAIFMYYRPKSSYAMDQDKMVAVMYTIIAPMLNPFIYTLRNSDMKIAIKKLIHTMMTDKMLLWQ